MSWEVATGADTGFGTGAAGKINAAECIEERNCRPELAPFREDSAEAEEDLSGTESEEETSDVDGLDAGATVLAGARFELPSKDTLNRGALLKDCDAV